MISNDMKRVFAILSIFLTTACSLFEDRGMCPDFVVLDLDYFPDRSCDESFKLMHWHDDFLVEKSDMPEHLKAVEIIESKKKILLLGYDFFQYSKSQETCIFFASPLHGSS